MIARPRVYISAAHKSSGKTTLSIGLCAALAERGMDVHPFKKGPDYIDPMWLSRASGRACFNLDFNTQNVDEIKSLFVARSMTNGISVIEGNKGLYDGVDVRGLDSNAALAKHLKAPVILVLDVSGITRGVAPLVLGYQAFDENVQIEGIILNKVGGARVERKLRSVLEHYTDIRVLGAVGRDEALEVRERHLGLTTPGEVGRRDEIIALLRSKVVESVNLEELIEIARSAVPMEAEPVPALNDTASNPVRIGIARDAAFGFYYADDIEALERHGAEIVYFDTLDDPHLPDVDGLFIGGGFPEMHMERLAGNKSLRAEIADAVNAGMPVYAECGGLMYLARSISWSGQRFDMVGAIPADVIMHDRPQGRGLVLLGETDRHPWGMQAGGAGAGTGAGHLAAHEFHYAALVNVEPGLSYAYEVQRGTGIDGSNDGIVFKNVLANFAHLRDTSRWRWTAGFIDFVRKNRITGKAV